MPVQHLANLKSTREDKPTSRQVVGALLRALITPLASRLNALGIIGAYLTMAPDMEREAFGITYTLPTLLISTASGRFAAPVEHTVYFQAIRLSRIYFLKESMDCNLTGYLGNVPIPFAELATRNQTISLYELDWLLSQHVARWEAVAVENALTATEAAGD